MRSRVEDEDMLNRLSRVTSFEVLQLHARSNLTRDSEKHGIDTMDLGGLYIDKLENREKDYSLGAENETSIYHRQPSGENEGSHFMVLQSISFTSRRREDVHT